MHIQLGDSFTREGVLHRWQQRGHGDNGKQSQWQRQILTHPPRETGSFDREPTHWDSVFTRLYRPVNKRPWLTKSVRTLRDYILEYFQYWKEELKTSCLWVLLNYIEKKLDSNKRNSIWGETRLRLLKVWPKFEAISFDLMTSDKI